MELLNIFALLIVLTAVFSYLNHGFIGLPVSIGVMLIALLLSVLLNLLGLMGLGLQHQAETWLSAIEFEETLLHGMLSFLLFAGALHINLNDLKERRWSIGLLASVGVLISTFLVGTATWWLLGVLGIGMPYLYCLVFGALISPTDPIAVLGLLKTVGAPKSLETKIVGESLFNDGVGIVVFLALLELTRGHHAVNAGEVTLLFVQEVVGGAMFGLGLGYVAYRMLKSVDGYQVEVLITLALVFGGYALANSLHLSGPIAIVLAGLLIGNHGRAFGMSETTRHHLDVFWELIDEILNAVLFVLIGLEVMVLTFTRWHLLAGALLIPVVLALSLPAGPERETMLTITYILVVFSIVVQGLTLPRLMRRILPRDTAS